MVCCLIQDDHVCPGSDTSEDPIEAALHDLVDPWVLDPTAPMGQEADDADAWFDHMDAAAITAASAAKAAAFATLDGHCADPGDTSYNLATLCDPLLSVA